MDEFSARRLVAAVIEQAVFDRRLAFTLGLINENIESAKKLKSVEVEMVTGLHHFFLCGGLEVALDVGGFDIDAENIRRKSCEKIKGRERRSTVSE